SLVIILPVRARSSSTAAPGICPRLTAPSRHTPTNASVIGENIDPTIRDPRQSESATARPPTCKGAHPPEPGNKKPPEGGFLWYQVRLDQLSFSLIRAALPDRARR